MTLLNQYSNIEEAYLDKSLLESHGIKALVQSDAMSELFPAPGAGMGSISLYVPDNEAQKAQEILNQK